MFRRTLIKFSRIIAFFRRIDFKLYYKNNWNLISGWIPVKIVLFIKIINKKS